MKFCDCRRTQFTDMHRQNRLHVVDEYAIVTAHSIDIKQKKVTDYRKKAKGAFQYCRSKSQEVHHSAIGLVSVTGSRRCKAAHCCHQSRA